MTARETTGGRRLTRRVFLVILPIAVVGVSAAILMGGRDTLQRYAEHGVDLVWSPSRRLRRHFAYLNIAPAVFDEYIADHERYIRRLSRFKSWPDDTYTRFLMSTDFFQNGADESRPLKYKFFYHPYVTLCYNPLARVS